MNARIADPWLLVIAAAAATYVWRAAGVALSGRVGTESEIFKWAACVAYAMVAGLIARILIMPAGLLATSPLIDRLVSAGLVLAIFYLTRRNLFAAVIAGVAAIVGIREARLLFGLI